MRKVVVKKRISGGKVEISVNNYTKKPAVVTIYNMSEDSASDAVPKADFIDKIGDEYNKVWKVEVEAESAWKTEYSGSSHGSVSVRGVDEKQLVVVDLF